MYPRTFQVISFVLDVVLPMAIAPAATLAQGGQRCFVETGFCIEGRIREYWEQNGGLTAFGFPIGPQQQELIEGLPIQAQWFERNRLELHPEHARPYDVLLGRLGVDRLRQQGRDWFGFPKGQPQNGCRFFAETGHSLCPPFLGYWRSHGLTLDGRTGVSEAESLALVGLPISEPQAETLGDGKSYTVQWFERARLEAHTENQPPYDVLLGLLGVEMRGALTPPAPSLSPSKFNFETGTQGWKAQVFPGYLAVTKVEQSTTQFHSGQHSLALNMDLKDEGQSKCEDQEPGEGKCKGEAYVALDETPISGLQTPLNMTGVRIRVWIYVPSEQAAGNPGTPNGVQVFVKDVNYENYRGSWTNLSGRTGTWFEVAITPSREKPAGGYVDPAFDPTKVIWVGVKIGAGIGGGRSYQGTIYMDDVDWQ